MTREEAKKLAIETIEKGIAEYGLDSPFMSCPRSGKNTWTFKEAKESIEQDKCLEGLDHNLIDDLMRLDEYLIEQFGKGLL